MDAINTLRAVLVAGAALAAVVAAVFGWWLTAGMFTLGIAMHGLLWLHLHRAGSRPPPAPDGPHGGAYRG